jgi:hypothetical protein
MTRSDWLEIGLKLLGTYFLVVGVAAVWRGALALLLRFPTTPLHVLELLAPLAEILAGIVLIRLRWELIEPGRRQTKPLPGYLDEQFEQMEKGDESTAS